MDYVRDVTFVQEPSTEDSSITLLRIGEVVFRIRNADRPGAHIMSGFNSQVHQIAAALATIPSHHHQAIAQAEIRVVELRSGGGAYSFRRNVLTLSNARFSDIGINRRNFVTLIHECGHAYDDIMHCTQAIRSRNREGIRREEEWARTHRIENWRAGSSETFPAASPPDEWDHFRAIDYRGRNKKPSGLPQDGESFAEGYMLYITDNRTRFTREQRNIIHEFI